MNFSELSDFEINKTVAESLGMNARKKSSCVNHGEGESAVSVGFGGCMRAFDPCNNPSDAWSIIVDNEISIEKNSRNTEYWRAITWEQINGSEFRPIEQCADKNPLRAAMIVYLMMQEEAA
ncbi:phage protein NinX family protein [Alteromonas macleodii]|uniref:phage protein NinX family protein n=1 Tax=Alteromonas macleodii TaxID=28108 RepID=UPI003D06465D